MPKTTEISPETMALVKRGAEVRGIKRAPTPSEGTLLTRSEQLEADQVLDEAIETAKGRDLGPANVPATRDERRISNKLVMGAAFKNFEKAAGGRRVLASTLHHCPEASAGYKSVQKLMADRDFDTERRYSLMAIAKRHQIPLWALVTAFRDAKMAEMALNTIVKVSNYAPDVVEQVGGDALNRFIECHVCEGTARVRKMNDYGEWQLDGAGAPVTQLCYNCRGTGKTFKEHDTATRTNFLKMAGFLHDRAPVNISNQMAILKNDFLPGDGSFERLIGSIDAVTVTSPKEEPIDTEIVQYDNEP